MTKAAKRLSENVVICEKTGCHLWTRYRDRNGYGIINIDKRIKIRAHREAWRLAYGDIPPGMMVCHTCDNPPCCNPNHLFLGTARDNMHDAMTKDRLTFRKLTLAQAQDIYDRHRAGETYASIGRRFGITPNNAYAIFTGRTWAEVKRVSHHE